VERYASRIAAWISGKIAADGTPEVLKDPEVIRNIIGG
jgi:branched-chain amino acid transport system ATP-binding protein